VPEAIVLYGHWDNGMAFPDCCCWTVDWAYPAMPAIRWLGAASVTSGGPDIPIFHQKEVQRVVTTPCCGPGPRPKRYAVKHLGMQTP
jgi:hypothetical protein